MNVTCDDVWKDAIKASGTFAFQDVMVEFVRLVKETDIERAVWLSYAKELIDAFNDYAIYKMRSDANECKRIL